MKKKLLLLCLPFLILVGCGKGNDTSEPATAESSTELMTSIPESTTQEIQMPEIIEVSWPLDDFGFPVINYNDFAATYAKAIAHLTTMEKTEESSNNGVDFVGYTVKPDMSLDGCIFYMSYDKSNNIRDLIFYMTPGTSNYFYIYKAISCVNSEVDTDELLKQLDVREDGKGDPCLNVVNKSWGHLIFEREEDMYKFGILFYDEKESSNSLDSETTESAPTETEPPSPSENITMGQKNALSSAKNYLNIIAFSYSGLISQLEYEGFTNEEATYAADNCGADWMEQALKKAKDYLNTSPFSYSGLIGQLEYEGFSTEEATYGVDNCGADWMEQAAKSAQNYIDLMSFSRSGLIDQLEYEGFTAEQAEYGASAVGY